MSDDYLRLKYSLEAVPWLFTHMTVLQDSRCGGVAMGQISMCEIHDGHHGKVRGTQVGTHREIRGVSQSSSLPCLCT
jgi:hypothetical protein